MVERPKVDYTMTWDCTFIIDGKTEEITFLTDDIEDVYGEYLELKKKYKSVVWMKHELHRKGRLILSPQMFPVDEHVAIVTADDTPPEHVWMEGHNRNIAAHMLRER
jgi:hypothetical protein